MADVWMLSQPVKTTGCERIKARQRLKAGNGHGNYLRFVRLFVFAFLFLLLVLLFTEEVKTQKLSVVVQIN